LLDFTLLTNIANLLFTVCNHGVGSSILPRSTKHLPYVSIRAIRGNARHFLRRDALVHGFPPDSGFRTLWSFGNCENSFDVGKGEDPTLPVTDNFGVFAGFETPTERVRDDTQERAQVPRPIAVLLGDSESVALGRQVFCVWFFEGYLNFA
jgi:hypothetical protein